MAQYMGCLCPGATIIFARSCKTDEVTLFWVYASAVGNYPAFFSTFGPDANFYCLYFKEGDPAHNVSDGIINWELPSSPISSEPWLMQSYEHCEDCGYIQMRTCSDGSDLPYWMDIESARTLSTVFQYGGYCAHFDLVDTPSDYSLGWIYERGAVANPAFAQSQADCETCGEAYPSQPCAIPTFLKFVLKTTPTLTCGAYNNPADGYGGGVATVNSLGEIISVTYILPRMDWSTGTYSFIDFDAAVKINLLSGSSCSSMGSLEHVQTVGFNPQISKSGTSQMTVALAVIDPGTGGSYIYNNVGENTVPSGNISIPSVLTLSSSQTSTTDLMLDATMEITPGCTVITVGDSGYGLGTDTLVTMDNGGHTFTIQFTADGEWYFQWRDQIGGSGIAHLTPCNRNEASSWLTQVSGPSSGGPGAYTLGFTMAANTTGLSRSAYWNILNIAGEFDQNA